MLRRLLILLAACGGPLLGADLVAVANRSAGAHLLPEEAANLLMGRTSAWPDGQRMTLVISAGESGEAAVASVTGRNVARLMRAWKRLVFSGTAAMPEVAADDAAALALVAKTPDAVVLMRVPPLIQPPPGVVVVRIAGIDADGRLIQP